MISAQVLADSVNPVGNRLTSFLLTFPRFILAEFNTHRMLSRNAASSRAIPVRKMLAKVWHDPAGPVSWGSNRPGMQAGGELTGFRRWLAQKLWTSSRLGALGMAFVMSKLGVHKQIVNRLLEPFTWVSVLATATEWGNFFNLRVHKDAQPEFQALAAAMLEAYRDSTPKALAAGQWHLPFAGRYGSESLPEAMFLKIVTARAARLSYGTHEGDVDHDKDYALHDRLVESGHWCYDADTEVLTSCGWKSWPIVSRKDILAAFDYRSRSIHFEQPSLLCQSGYKGKMYRLVGQQVDLCVTPNHKMIVSCRLRQGWSPFYLEEARNTAGKPRRYLKSGHVIDRSLFVNPFGIDPVTFAKLVGFFAGDGYITSERAIGFHLHRERKIHFLQSLGLDVRTKKDGRYTLGYRTIGVWFRENCYIGEQKCLPLVYFQATEEEVKGLLEGLRQSDGSERRNTWVYDTTSPYLRDQVQIIGHLNDMVVSLSTTFRSSPHKDRYRLNFSRRLTPRVEITQTGRSRTYRESFGYYDGMVYCATVSTGALLVRRNGKVVVSGNSPFEHAAYALPEPRWVGNYCGWFPYRKQFTSENQRDFNPQVLLARLGRGT